jgi:hypothetical protein
MTPHEHYTEAERLIVEGEKVVGKIGDLAMKRVSITASKNLGALGLYDAARVADLTIKMDEYGKKAMGIWAQAQVHATLCRASGGDAYGDLSAVNR